ncbi:APC family permease, partial [Salinibacterium sp.]|uniref:APC family permease n=1 Tax=Salinibacterium sp. TaxID=1915057 RepID=UPI00286D3C3A
MFYGFEACGDVAEEVNDPSRRVPRAMYLTIFVGGVSALMSYAGYVLAAPDLQSIVSGEDLDPIPGILESSIGIVGAKVFLVIACMAFVSCVLSLQAAASRLLHSFARDGMLPGSSWLARLTPRTKVPRNALLVASIIPMLICVVVFIRPESLLQVTAFAVLGIYVAFQAVVLASLRQRFKGWMPAGPFNLGRMGIVVNIAALVYGLIAIYLLLIPGASGDFVTDYIAWIGLGVVVIIGALYLFIARPDRKSSAPDGDAIEVANKMRAHSG